MKKNAAAQELARRMWAKLSKPERIERQRKASIKGWATRRSGKRVNASKGG